MLYRVMLENLETWLERRKAAEADSGGVPAWVEGELRRYLECGILAHGFGRARCAACGHDFVVAFSCKRVIELFEKEGLLDDEAAANMRTWPHGGGFSLDATRVADRPE